MITVAFQGTRGAFSETAAQGYFPDGHCIPFRDFDSAVSAVLEGAVEFALIPLENSIAGPIPDNLKLVDQPRVRVVAEFWQPIHHMLMSLPGASIESLRNVLSHPVALAQCEKFFAQHRHAHATAWYDTAGAAEYVSRRGDAALGAIAPRAAAALYDLAILAENIEDHPDNRTRFCVITKA